MQPGTPAEVVRVARDLQRRDSMAQFITQLAKANGLPVWDKTFYNVGKKNSDNKIKTATAAREVADRHPGDVFLYPFGSNLVAIYRPM